MSLTDVIVAGAAGYVCVPWVAERVVRWRNRRALRALYRKAGMSDPRRRKG